MTILENNVTPPVRSSKLSLKGSCNSTNNKNTEENLKRKNPFQEIDRNSNIKKPMLGHMLNGYRSEQRGGNRDASQDSPVATLSNMGNTCFLNSVLYTLRFAPTFLHNLHHLIGDLSMVSSRLNQNKAKTSSLGRNIGAITGPSSRSTSSKDLLSLGTSTDIIPKSKVQIVTEKLHELFVTMHNIELKESSEPYQPVALLQAIRDANAIFEGNHQQDAHELLVYLLDNIRETCDILTQQVQHNPDLLLNDNDVVPPLTNSKLWNVRRSWKKMQKKKDKNSKECINEEQQALNGGTVMNQDGDDACSVDSNSADNLRRKIAYNFVAEDFEGITLRRTKCLECESVTERKEPFYDIPVPISVIDNNVEETGALTPSEIYRNACVTSEKLCDANKYLCEKCVRYNEASRDVLFEKLPNIMVLQLKRFTTSTTGVQKVNTYLPTPLELECFCETCCNVDENEPRPHRYQLCCVIMHLGGTMASGHYITYVKASNRNEDYIGCSRNTPKGNLSASSSEKSVFSKYFKSKTLTNSFIDNSKSILSKNNCIVANGVRTCKSKDCCGVKLNNNVVDNLINAKNGQEIWNNCSTPTNGLDDMWLECDDENIRPITSQELEEELDYKPNSTSTPYLLFYAKINEILTID